MSHLLWVGQNQDLNPKFDFWYIATFIECFFIRLFKLLQYFIHFLMCHIDSLLTVSMCFPLQLMKSQSLLVSGFHSSLLDFLAYTPPPSPKWVVNFGSKYMFFQAHLCTRHPLQSLGSKHPSNMLCPHLAPTSNVICSTSWTGCSSRHWDAALAAPDLEVQPTPTSANTTSVSVCTFCSPACCLLWTFSQLAG